MNAKKAAFWSERKKQAIFFSLLRKVFIVVPLTYLLPYAFHMGTDGVFLAEPVSNVIGGTLCFVIMLCTVLPELKQMERERVTPWQHAKIDKYRHFKE